MLKSMVVLSSGLAKFVPLIFGFYLTHSFGDGEYASYVLLLNYSAALTAVSTLGSTPIILRAGLMDNPKEAVFGAYMSGITTLFLFLLASTGFWVFIAEEGFFTHVEFSTFQEQSIIVLYCSGLLFLSLAHASLSQKERWTLLSLSYLFCYIVPFFIAVSFGFFYESGLLAVFAYCITFCLLSLLVFFLLIGKDLGFLFSRFVFASFFQIGSGILKGMRTSLFGVLLLVGFYFASKYANSQLSVADAAIYSLAFQFFSASIFIPSVLGSIVIPILSNRKKAELDKLDGLYVYVLISAAVGLVVIVFAPFFLDMYGFSADGVGLQVFVFFQVAALLASSCAYFIQRMVVFGAFFTLGIGAGIWLFILMVFLFFFNPGVVGISQVFIFSYIVMNFFNYISLGRIRGRMLTS